MNALVKASIVGAFTIFAFGESIIGVGAQEELTAEDVQFLGKSVPNIDNPRTFVTCDGDTIDPLPVGYQIIKVGLNCRPDDEIWSIFGKSIMIWARAEVQQALEQGATVAAQEALTAADQSLQEAFQYSEHQQPEDLQQAEQALRQAYNALERGDLQAVEQALEMQQWEEMQQQEEMQQREEMQQMQQMQ